ncbi:MAG TPA: 2-hydroxychromene-2-carboxylate isomerase [Candidatus Polarisedimenticolaceae bacterium]|nr:2-hydroxychromene-2-carboxylate isomerase [Candidatus Polarisedimenticolaceae bacterium]
MGERRRVRFYFDFVSPYSWLALMTATEFAARHRVEWEMRPVVFAALLDAAGLVGPVESNVKRRYTFVDVWRCARRAGLRLVGPPAHPFRSIEALRAACVFQDRPEALALVRRIAAACWSDGADLTDRRTLERLVRDTVAYDGPLATALDDPTIKRLLRENTDRAIADGAFGVPTFVLDGRLFWGQDRMDQLADALAGRDDPEAAELAQLIDRPRGADRRRTAG